MPEAYRPSEDELPTYVSYEGELPLHKLLPAVIDSAFLEGGDSDCIGADDEEFIILVDPRLGEPTKENLHELMNRARHVWLTNPSPIDPRTASPPQP